MSATPFIADTGLVYNYARGVDARVASNLHADAAVRAGIVGAQVVAVLHAELADAYAIIDDLESRSPVAWFMETLISWWLLAARDVARENVKGVKAIAGYAAGYRKAQVGKHLPDSTANPSSVSPLSGSPGGLGTSND